MATIVKRKYSYSAIYNNANEHGVRKQKREINKSLEEEKYRTNIDGILRHNLKNFVRSMNS